MKLNTKLLNIQYSLLHALYWGIICMIGGAFSSLFLLSRGYTNTRVGMAIATANVLGVVLQPFLASAVDAAKISLHTLSLLMTLLACAGFALQLFTGNHLLAVAAMFILSFTIVQSLQPLLNSLSLYYINRGAQVNFGVARGIGSAFYALLSTVFGSLVERYSANILLVGGIVMTVLFALLIRSLPSCPAVELDKKAPAANTGVLTFLRKYREFTVVLLGAMFLFTFHNMSNTYLFHIVSRVGGNSETLGTALSIAAIVELPVMFGFSLLAKRFHSRHLLIFAGVMFAVKAAAYLMAETVPQLYFCQALQMGCYGLYVPAGVFYMNELVEKADTVKGQALLLSAGTLGAMFASLSGGYIIDTFGVHRMLVLQVVLAAAGALLLFFAPTPKRKKED